MKTVPYTNNGTEPKTVCGKVIKPGETRDVDARFVPAPAVINSQLELLFINLGDSPRFFGEIEVVPGGYARLPANHFVDPNTNADQAQAELFRELLGKSIKEITPYFDAFTDEELLHLWAMDDGNDGQPRKGLSEAIDTELGVRRAERDFSPKAYTEHLKTLSDEDLDLELLQVNDDDQKLTLVQEELAVRKEAKANS